MGGQFAEQHRDEPDVQLSDPEVQSWSAAHPRASSGEPAAFSVGLAAGRSRGALDTEMERVGFVAVTHSPDATVRSAAEDGFDAGAVSTSTDVGEVIPVVGDPDLAAPVNGLSFDGPVDRLSLQVSPRSIRFVVDERHELNLDAPYQREGGLWSVTQKQNLIRSILGGIPTGDIVINRRPDPFEPYYVVDGKQRIEAIRGFIDGEFPIPRSWLSERWLDPEDPPQTVDVPGWPVPGVTHRGLGRRFGTLFNNSPIAFVESKVETVEEEATIYRLINSGGTAQTAETLAAAAAVERGAAR